MQQLPHKLYQTGAEISKTELSSADYQYQEPFTNHKRHIPFGRGLMGRQFLSRKKGDYKKVCLGIPSNQINTIVQMYSKSIECIPTFCLPLI